jgi:hypothetical protein
MAASVTINDPYCVHRSTPASIPSSVACRQNPASPMLSRTTLNSRSAVNTWADHSGAVTTMASAAPMPTTAAIRIGRVDAGGGRC